MPLTDNITKINFSGNKFFIMLIPQLSHFPENESNTFISGMVNIIDINGNIDIVVYVLENQNKILDLRYFCTTSGDNKFFLNHPTIHKNVQTVLET
jgi:hypothetical protein